jgi:hypothetical protein
MQRYATSLPECLWFSLLSWKITFLSCSHIFWQHQAPCLQNIQCNKWHQRKSGRWSHLVLLWCLGMSIWDELFAWWYASTITSGSLWLHLFPIICWDWGKYSKSLVLCEGRLAYASWHVSFISTLQMAEFAVWKLYGSSMALRPGLVQDSTLLLILDLLLLPWLHIGTRAILLGHSSFSFLWVLYN